MGGSRGYSIDLPSMVTVVCMFVCLSVSHYYGIAVYAWCMFAVIIMMSTANIHTLCIYIIYTYRLKERIMIRTLTGTQDGGSSGLHVLLFSNFIRAMVCMDEDAGGGLDIISRLVSW